MPEIGRFVRSVTDRAHRGRADALRALRRGGNPSVVRRLIGRSSRRDVVRWAEATSAAHELMRSSVDPAPGSVAVVCVSVRPTLLDDVLEHVAAQRLDDGDDVDFVFVANHPSFDVDALRARFDAQDTWRFLVPPSPISLGEGLNLAISQTDARFVAKFDDDDRYGPAHLADSLRAHSYAGAGVVGKHTYYADVVASSQHVVKFPGNEFRYSSALAGGTLVIDRERTSDLGFEEISLGEDQAFLRACHRRGISTFSADRFNFVQLRSGDNTWRVSDELFLDGAITVADLERERIMR